MSKIFVLHGWSYSTEKWEPFLKYLEDAGITYEFLKIPGLTAPLKEVWELSNYVSWLNKQVKSQKSKVVILGHSNGGRIASAFAEKYPQKVACLVLIDSAGILDRGMGSLIKKFVFSKLAKGGKKISSKPIFKKLMYKLAAAQDYNEANPIVKKTMVNLISIDLSEIFSKIIIPTLIIWGKNDKVTPLSNGIKIHSFIKGSEFLIIDGAKHSPQFTNAQETASKVLNFFKQYAHI